VTDCLIIGAGPYGLSLGAHLWANQIDFQIAGKVMGAWVSNMPDGMFLKSEGFASNLFEPGGQFTLARYCAIQGIPYADTGIPVSKDTFIGYGREFQKQFVPNLEERTAVAVTRSDDGFVTEFSDGGRVVSRRVVIAVGVGSYSQVPAILQALPPALCSHSSDHSSFAQFAGKTVAVIGGGSSAMDAAAALRRRGACVTVIARRRSVRFQTPLGQRSLRDKLRAPMTVVGPGWKSVLCTEAPLVFHHMPDAFRTKIVRRYLGPAPAWFVRDEIEGHVPILTGMTVREASVEDGGVRLTLGAEDGAARVIAADHVICATGYNVVVGRNSFIHRDLVAGIRDVDGAPRLSRNFESTVPGLFFIGPASANSFGPMLRFAAGAGFTARRLSRHLVASRLRQGQRRVDAAPSRAMAVDA
jgi:cation diffusion facilitator CzcD-associated flavoprotein CzcO